MSFGIVKQLGIRLNFGLKDLAWTSSILSTENQNCESTARRYERSEEKRERDIKWEGYKVYAPISLKCHDELHQTCPLPAED